MDEFDKHLQKINVEDIKDYISLLDSPCYESKLLKIAFPEMDIQTADSLLLYQNHFVLFHFLFKLHDYYLKRNRYLHIHFMRIFLFDFPSYGKCRFFGENVMNFCNAKCNENNSYCDFHLKNMEEKALENLSIKFFYLDKNNYFRLDKNMADKLINGAWEILNNYDVYEESFKILDLPKSCDVNMVKRKFKILAKKFHPDINEGNSEQFIKINNAYRLLTRIMSI